MFRFRSGRRPHILVVDDEPDMCWALENILRPAGYAVTTTTSGAEAIEKAQGRFFNLALLDIRLPDMEGIELVAPLKKMHPDMVVMIVTAYASLETAVQALNNGASAYITKPLNVDEVLATVRGGLEKQRLVMEKRQVEEALRESEARYRLLAENANDAIYMLDSDLRITDVNPFTEQAIGYSQDELIGRSFPELGLLAPASLGLALEDAARVLAGERISGAVYEFITKGERHLFGEVSGAPIYQEGQVVGVLAIARDITERKRAEEAIKLFRRLVDQSNDAIEVVDPETLRFLDINEKACQDLGYSREELLSLTVFDVDPAIDQPSVARVGEELRKTGFMIIESQHRRKDGSMFPVEINMKYVQFDRSYVINVARDITERRRAEEALRASEERYRSLFDGVPVGLYRTTVAGQFLDANPALAKMLGYLDRESLLAANAVDMYVDSEDRRRWQALMECEGVMRASEVQWRCHDGTVIGVQESAHAVRGTDGRVLYYEGGVENITERKRAEEALRASEQRYRLLFERTLAGVYRSTLDGRILDCNESYARIFGYDSPEEILALRASEFYFDAADRETFIVQLREQGTLTNSEWCLRRKDNSPVWVLENASLIEGEEGAPPFIQGTLVDITRRKRAERLLQALNQAARAMGKAMTPEEIFAAVAEELKKLGFACVVFLTDESQKRLFPKYLSYEAKAIKAAEKLVGLKAADLPIPVETVEVYRKVIRERKTVFVENAEEVVRQLLPGPAKRLARQIAKMLKVSKSIDAPLVAEGEVIGLLLVQSNDLTEDDIPAISAFAHQMAAAWRKAQLMKDLERSLAEQKQAEEELQHTLAKLREALGGIIQTVALMVETRDPYTAGHQRRVADLARAIANEMDLPQEQIDGIRMAGLIHDLGKINVPAEILSKPTRLTEFERGMIQTHPQVGYDILKTIDFPWPVAQIVLQHHERMDGSGYPQGLSGEEIMLEARVLAVADVVEAMASFRPYRPAHGIDKALEEISQNRGALYDAEAVDACLKLFTEKGFKFE